VSFNFDEALTAFLQGGSMKDLEDGLNEAAGKGLLQGLMDAMFSPIIEAGTKKIGDMLEAARKDGVITPEELANIEKASKNVTTDLKNAAIAAKPLYEQVAKDFGIDLKNSAEGGLTEGLKDAALKYLQGGSAEDLKKSMKEAAYNGLIEGMIDAILAGPAIKEFEDKWKTAVDKAMEDGIIDAKESRHLNKLADEGGAAVVKALDAAGPAAEKLAKRFGISMGKDLFEEIKGGISSAFLNAKSPEEFKQQVKQSVYNSVLKGMVDALVTSVIIQGALKPLLDKLSAIWAQAAADGTVAGIQKAVTLSGPILKDIGVQIDQLGPAFDLVSDAAADWAKTLGITTEAANATTEAANATTEATQQQQEASFDLRRSTIELGDIATDLLGQQAKAAFEVIAPAFPADVDPAVREDIMRKMNELLERLLNEGVEATTYLDGQQVSRETTRGNRARARSGATV